MQALLRAVHGDQFSWLHSRLHLPRIDFVGLGLHTVLLWIVVGLVAGFLASVAMLGHGVGLIRDTLIGLAGAAIGGYLADRFQVSVIVIGHPIISEIIVAFVGALLFTVVLRLLGVGRRLGYR